MPVSAPARWRSTPSNPMPCARGPDLARIGRAHRSQVVGVLQSGFQKADLTMILEAVDREARRRQAKTRPGAPPGTGPGRRVVDVNTVGGRGRAGKRQVRRHEAALPVVGVHQIRRQPPISPSADPAADPGKRGEAKMVVRPVPAVRAEVGIARPGVEVRGRSARISTRRRCGRGPGGRGRRTGPGRRRPPGRRPDARPPRGRPAAGRARRRRAWQAPAAAPRRRRRGRRS